MERSRGEGAIRGQRGEGAPRLQPRASQRGPRRSGLPFQLRSGHASPAPHPPLLRPALRPEAGQGKYPPPGTFGTRASELPARSQNPGVHPHPVPSPPPASPSCAPGSRRAPQACGEPAPRLFSPELASPGPRSRLSWNPDIAGHSHPALTTQTSNLGTKRRQPKVRAGDGRGYGRGDTPFPGLKPLSQLTCRGAPRGGGAEEPGVRREEERGRGGERDRGRSGDRREGRREGEEEGKRELRRRDRGRDLGAGQGAATALSEDNGERDGGAGRSRTRGRSLAPS